MFGMGNNSSIARTAQASGANQNPAARPTALVGNLATEQGIQQAMAKVAAILFGPQGKSHLSTRGDTVSVVKRADADTSASSGKGTSTTPGSQVGSATPGHGGARTARGRD
jgi:hypothetical protein